jgi:hypothetical protein
MRMLFDHYESDRLVICLDTSSLDLMRDFFSDRATVRMLEVECGFDDDYLVGHAMRVGLAGPQTGEATLAGLLPTIRHDMIYERDAIRDAKFAHTTRIKETATSDENAHALAQFLCVSPDLARTLADTPHLFVD